ncbi:MAG TPA: CBS domain-containing protein [Thermoanaerobaculia bacterium]|jgi:CBS domain-containing protein|nr:CBS domain-containing protein [Thermoanaerobaculia bacterium]
MAQERNQKSGGGSRRARDVMTPNPATVSQKDSIRDAARIMASEDTGVVPVVDGRKIVGLVTDRDIVIRCVAEGKDTATAKVKECMTQSVRSVKEDTPVAEVLTMMSNAQIRRVPVVNNIDELVGIVSIGDISTETNQDGKVGRTIEQISQGPSNN